MLFNSYLFIFVFLPIVLLGFLILRRQSPFWPIIWIILASLFYYGWWKPQFLLLLLASISINLIFAKIILRLSLSPTMSKFVLFLGVLFNLTLLGYFKYAGFLVVNFNSLFGVSLNVPNVILPLGISFITFQKIAFLVDAHRGLVRNFSILDYIFFVTFFPQLIAGPIVHHAEIMPQLRNSMQRDFKIDFSIGISIFIVGLFKKVIVADTLAVYADAGYSMVKDGLPLDTASAWITVLSYSLQLYYDFSGYSDMAIGFARMFGIVLPLNFYSPYKAQSIIDFWRRWHITLSRFLRDYLYFPLGGNRHGTLRRYVNLAIVMLLGGLWHGANWTFAVWGGIHGLLLSVNHAWRKLPFTKYSFYQTKLIRSFSIATTFLLVTLAWVPFRANTIAEAKIMFGNLFSNFNKHEGLHSFGNFFHNQFTNLHGITKWFIPRELWPTVLPPDFLATTARPVGIELLIFLSAVFLIPNTAQLFNRFNPALHLDAHPHASLSALPNLGARLAMMLALMFVFCILKLSHVSPFLYFQF